LSGGNRSRLAFLTGQIERRHGRTTPNADRRGRGHLMLQDGWGPRLVMRLPAGSGRCFGRCAACLAAGVELVRRRDLSKTCRIRTSFVYDADVDRWPPVRRGGAYVSSFIAFDCYHYMGPHRPRDGRFTTLPQGLRDKPFYTVLAPA